MTSEEAIKCLKGFNLYMTSSKYSIGDAYIAIEMAINALKSKGVLDKIRAEIEALEYLNIEDGSDGYDQYIEQYGVLKIIDRYIAESEV